MKKIRAFVLILILITILCSCSVDESQFTELQNDVESLTLKLAAANHKINSLETLNVKLTSLNSKISDLESENSNYERELESLKYMIEVNTLTNSYENTLLTLHNAKVHFKKNSYNVASTRFGNIFISIIDIEPYLDGAKIYLNIGNPNNFTVSEFELNIIPMSSENDFPNTVLTDSNHFEFKSNLSPGYWNNVEVIIRNVDPNIITGLDVEVIINVTSLKR